MRRVLTFTLAAISLAIGAGSAFAQGWPLPAKTPETPITCVSNTTACLGKENKKLPGYPAVFKTFTGRYLDSVASRDYQYYFRTARARMIRLAPERNRIYMILGSAVAAYDLRTFFTRLEATETLFPSTSVPVSPPNTRYNPSDPEVFLKWDSWFYAESGGGWVTQAGDGQERLFGVDYDDRGNVYLAYGAYSWGIVKDDGITTEARMTSLYQHTKPALTDEVDVSRIFSLKSGGSYYAVVSGKYPRVNIFNVNTPSAPTKHRDTLGGPITELVKNTDGSRIALVKGDGSFAIYATDTFLANGAALLGRDALDGTYTSVTTDGTNFFAGVRSGNGKLTIVAYSPAGSSYAETKYEQNLSIAAGVTIRYGAGFITAAAVEIPPGAFTLHLFKVNGTEPTEIPLGSYYTKYYTTASEALNGTGFTYPAYSVLLDTAVYQTGGKYYLMLADFGLGDVYEIDAANLFLAAPTGLAATASTTARVDLSWNAVAGAASYVVERKSTGGDFAQIGTSDTNSYSDRSASKDKAYLYRVRAANSITVSPYSLPDLATTVMFDDSILRPYETTIRAAHVVQLQTAINAFRELAGLDSYSFTPVVAGDTIRAVHLTELRTAIDGACGAVGHSTGGFIDSSPVGVVDKAAHIQQIRDRVQ